MNRKIVTMEGFYYWFMANVSTPEKLHLKYMLGRLAREFPQANPRKVFLEFMAELMTEYEQHLAYLNGANTEHNYEDSWARLQRIFEKNAPGSDRRAVGEKQREKLEARKAMQRSRRRELAVLGVEQSEFDVERWAEKATYRSLYARTLDDKQHPDSEQMVPGEDASGPE